MKSVLCVLSALLMFSGHVANAATVPQRFTDLLVAAGLSNPTATTHPLSRMVLML